MKSHSSSSYSADLHDFKMNLTKPLNSNYMLTFNEQKRQLSSRFKQKSNLHQCELALHRPYSPLYCVYSLPAKYFRHLTYSDCNCRKAIFPKQVLLDFFLFAKQSYHFTEQGKKYVYPLKVRFLSRQRRSGNRRGAAQLSYF